jgi:hypothetical protein
MACDLCRPDKQFEDTEEEGEEKGGALLVGAIIGGALGLGIMLIVAAYTIAGTGRAVMAAAGAAIVGALAVGFAFLVHACRSQIAARRVRCGCQSRKPAPLEDLP